jgi:aspartate aminotransferase-like enzyme
MSFGRFFLPGPSEVHPEVLRAMQRPMIAHRSAECAELMQSVQPVLQELFGTTRPVLIGATSATGFMEAGVRSIPRGGDSSGRNSSSRVLALVNGAFSERFAQIAEACGHEVVRDVVPWGEAHDPVELAKQFAGKFAGNGAGKFAGVLVAHNETSTGVVQPIAELAKAISPTPLLVDSTSGIGGVEMRFDEWNLAFALTGSQKALALPPGLAFAVIRDDLLENDPESFYFDLRRYSKNPPPFTPALPQLYALAAQVERIAAEGVPARLERHRAMAARMHEWAGDREILANAENRSPTVTCVLDDGSTRGRAAAAGFTIADGYGKLKGDAYRVGHMGDQTVETLNVLLAAIDQ